MNIIRKKQGKLENPGIDPGASRIQIERSATWKLIPVLHWILFTNIFVISSWVAISNEYIYKETGIGEFGIDPGDLEYKSNALPLELIPLCIVSIDQYFPYFLVRCI